MLYIMDPENVEKFVIILLLPPVDYNSQLNDNILHNPDRIKHMI